MSKRININMWRIKEACDAIGKSIEWLATQVETVDNHGNVKTGCSKQSLYNYAADGFSEETANSIESALGVKLSWLKTRLENKHRINRA